MKPLCLLCVLILACLTVSPVLYSRQETAPKGVPAGSAESYPDTTDGLHRLLMDLLFTAKSNDSAKLRSQIVDLEIPDYESWFKQMFGQERGEKWAGSYGKLLQLNESQFELLCMELAKQEGEISIEKIDAAKRYGALPDPLDVYTANWKKTDDSPGPDRQPIGQFYFVGGKFRLTGSSLREIRILTPVKPGPVVPAKLINRVPPVYPETARHMRIQGTVAINVIIKKDGTVTVQNVGAGHPLLVPAAVAAVQQWLYEPTTVGGEPVEVQTKIYVTFTLNREQGEQKQ